MMEALLNRQTEIKKGLTKISLWFFAYFWPGWSWPVNLEMARAHSPRCAGTPGSVGPPVSIPPCGQDPYQGDTMPTNSPLVSALASTPALLIYLLSLMRLSYKPNNSAFGSVQTAPTFITEFSVQPHSCWGEWTLSCISLLYDWQWIWGVVSTIPLCTLSCTHAPGEDKRSNTELISTWQAFKAI